MNYENGIFRLNLIKKSNKIPTIKYITKVIIHFKIFIINYY